MTLRFQRSPFDAHRIATRSVGVGVVLFTLAGACVAQTPHDDPQQINPSSLPLPPVVLPDGVPTATPRPPVLIPARPGAAAELGGVGEAAVPPGPFVRSQLGETDLVEEPISTDGAIQRFLTNPEGDVDGLVLSQDVVVRTPPHLGKQLVSIVHAGDRVQIEGMRTHGGDISVTRIVNMRSGQQLTDAPPTANGPRSLPRMPGAGLVRLAATGAVVLVTTTPRGEPDGVLLDDGMLVKVTPPAAQSLHALLKPGARIAATGYGTRTPYGEAMQATAFGTPDHVIPLYGNDTQ